MTALLNRVRSRKVIRLGLPLAALVATAGALLAPNLGSARSQSAPVNTAEPTNTGLPTITGAAAVGQTLTASEGTWASKYLVDFSYAWLRCDAAGSNCAASGATGATYVVAAADMGSTLRVRVTATNPAGTTQV